jgi:hypothetical protein
VLLSAKSTEKIHIAGLLYDMLSGKGWFTGLTGGILLAHVSDRNV